MNIDLTRISFLTWSSFIALLVSISLGILAIFICDPDIFWNKEVIKLILLANSLTIPFLTLNAVFFKIFVSPNQDSKEKQSEFTQTSIVNGCIVLFSSLLFSCIIKLLFFCMPIKCFALFVLITNVLLLMLSKRHKRYFYKN